MPRLDPFEDIARYYDTIMEHVDYERWVMVCRTLGAMLPPNSVHVDAACGTGVLVRRLRKHGWNSFGFDLSPAMLSVAKRNWPELHAAVGDLCAPPFRGSAGLVTCLFDSINFLLDEAAVRACIRQLAGMLTGDGLLYFDIVTERMVTEHFENQTWVEDSGAFKTTWSSTYDRKSAIADTELRINYGAPSLIRERIFPTELFEDAVAEAGLHLLGKFNGKDWRPPTRRTTRIDFVAAHRSDREFQKGFERAAAHVRKQIVR